MTCTILLILLSFQFGTFFAAHGFLNIFYCIFLLNPNTKLFKNVGRVAHIYSTPIFFEQCNFRVRQALVLAMA